jgi:hypothetical protein
MTYRGRFRNGVVVLEGDARLPEGTEVRVEPITNGLPAAGEADDPIFRIVDFAVDTGIPDLATNLDHYLYGHPKVNHNREKGAP